MRAAILRQGNIVVDQLPDPKPGNGQVLVKTLACGICGTDLHARLYADHMNKSLAHVPGAGMDFRGHRLRARVRAEVIENGPGTEGRFRPGTRVTSVPGRRRARRRRRLLDHHISGYAGGCCREAVRSGGMAILDVPRYANRCRRHPCRRQARLQDGECRWSSAAARSASPSSRLRLKRKTVRLVRSPRTFAQAARDRGPRRRYRRRSGDGIAIHDLGSCARLLRRPPNACFARHRPGGDPPQVSGCVGAGMIRTCSRAAGRVVVVGVAWRRTASSRCSRSSRS